MSARWAAHKRAWKKDKPIHRQQLFTQYLYFFGDQIDWQVLVDIGTLDQQGWAYGDAALLEVLEREVFFQTKPIANAYIPNGWDTMRLIESGGEPYAISEWNPNMVEIRVKKGEFAGFSDGKGRFERAKAAGLA